MPWFAWIAIVAIVAWGLIAVISMTTGRPLPSGANRDEVEQLKKRIAELEAQPESPPEPAPEQLEDRIPTKSEENLAAEDRWRLEMLEARLEELEQRRRDKPEDPEDPRS